MTNLYTRLKAKNAEARIDVPIGPDQVSPLSLDVTTPGNLAGFKRILEVMSGAGITGRDADILSLFTGGVYSDLGSGTAVHLGGNVKYTPSNVAGLTYSRTQTAPTDLDGEWAVVRLDDTRNAILKRLRTAIGNDDDDAEALTGFEFVTSAGGLHYYQKQIKASQHDVIRVQEGTPYTIDEVRVSLTNFLASLVPLLDVSDLTSDDNGTIGVYNNGNKAYVRGGFANGHGMVFEFDPATDNFSARLYWSGDALPDLTDSAIRGRYSIGDRFIRSDGRIYKLTASNTASNTVTVTFVAANSPERNPTGYETSGWNRLAGSTNFGPNPAPIADLPIFETNRQDGTQAFSRVDVKRYFSIEIGGNEVVRIARVQGPSVSGVFRYANTLPGNKIFDAGSVTMTVHASDGTPFMQTVDHWSLEYAPDADLNVPVLQNMAQGISGGGWRDYVRGTVTEQPAVSVPVDTEPTTTSIVADAQYGIGPIVSGNKTNEWVQMRVPIANDDKTTRWAIYNGQDASYYALPPTALETNDTYRFFYRQIPFVPDGAEVRAQFFDPMELDPAFYGNANPLLADLEDNDILQYKEARKGIVGEQPGPGVGDDTTAAIRRGRTAVWTVAARTWTNLSFSTNWTLPSEGRYEIVVIIGAKRDAIEFEAEDIREVAESVVGIDSSGSTVGALERRLGIRLLRTRANTLHIAAAPNLANTSMTCYPVGSHARFDEASLPTTMYPALPATRNISIPDTANTFGTSFEPVFRYTATINELVDFRWSFNPQATWSPRGGGDRASIHMRVRHMRPGTPDTQVRMIDENDNIYIRNGAQGTTALIGTLEGYYAWAAYVELQANDYILIDARAWAQQSITSTNATNRVSSSTIEITPAKSHLQVQRMRAVSGTGLTQDNVDARVEAIRPYKEWVGPQSDYDAIAEKDQFTGYNIIPSG